MTFLFGWLLALAVAGSGPGGSTSPETASVPPARVASWPGPLPPIVFVQRAPGPAGLVPGVGPHGRFLATGGRLLVRDAKGRVHPLLAGGTFYDVSDPCVSWDGERIAFAATIHPDSAWRIWEVDAEGRDLRAVTHGDRGLDLGAFGGRSSRGARYDDIDPCWLPDGRVCFASTRYPQRAQFEDLPVTNLFVTRTDGGPPGRITSERNGAEEPCLHPRDGHVVYARWWFNRFLPADDAPLGITLDRARAVPQDTINLWTAVSVTTDGGGVKLAAGDARVRAAMRAYQPAILRDGSAVGVWAENPAMTPAPGRLGLYRFRNGVGPATRLTGPGTEHPGDACAPAALPDGRLLFSWDPAGTGDLGLYTMRPDGTGTARVTDLAGTWELDAAPVVRRRPPVVPPEEFPFPAPPVPLTLPHQVQDSTLAFRFDCGNVFTNAAVDAPIPDAPPLQKHLRIRFFGVVARPDRAGGDSLVLLREVPIDPSGAIHVDNIVADSPVFEQLVDAEGRVVRSARGPAHVPGFNFSRLGSGTKCVGCHTGHSVIPAPVNNWLAKWFNAAPSADVQVSSVALGSARALVDRRTRGPVDQVAWVAAGSRDERVRLSWQTPIELRALVLYALESTDSEGPLIRVQETEISFFEAGREVKHLTVRRALSPRGTRVECDPVRVDAVEIAPTRVRGRVQHRSAVALAEIETIARLVED